MKKNTPADELKRISASKLSDILKARFEKTDQTNIDSEIAVANSYITEHISLLTQETKKARNSYLHFFDFYTEKMVNKDVKVILLTDFQKAFKDGGIDEEFTYRIEQCLQEDGCTGVLANHYVKLLCKKHRAENLRFLGSQNFDFLIGKLSGKAPSSEVVKAREAVVSAIL